MTIQAGNEMATSCESFKPTRVILIPIDDSDLSTETVKFTIQTIANKDTDLIILVNVRPSVHHSFTLGSTSTHFIQIFPKDTLGAAEEQLKQHAHALLRNHCKDLIAADIHYRAIALVGDVREQLEAEVNNIMPDLVIMGRTGKSALKSLVMGSVSNHFAHTCKVPILFYQ